MKISPQALAIEADVAYSLPEFERRTQLGKAAMREARRAGLKIRQVGSRRFVLGSDWLEHLKGRPPVE